MEKKKKNKTEMVTELTRFEDKVLETVKWCQERKYPLLVWGMEVSKCVKEAGLVLPSTELGQILVSNLCFANNIPSLWKFLEQAISSGILSSIQISSLLTARVVSNRRTQPEAYRHYLELLNRYAFSLAPFGTDLCKQKIIKSVDDALQLSQTYGVQILEPGHALVLFFFGIIIGLVDCTFDDWGLQPASIDKTNSMFGVGEHQYMDVDHQGSLNDKRTEHHEQLRKANAFTAIEILTKLTESKKNDDPTPSCSLKPVQAIKPFDC